MTQQEQEQMEREIRVRKEGFRIWRTDFDDRLRKEALRHPSRSQVTCLIGFNSGSLFL